MYQEHQILIKNSQTCKNVIRSLILRHPVHTQLRRDDKQEMRESITYKKKQSKTTN